MGSSVWTYDGLERVTSETGALSETFTLDGEGNLTSRAGGPLTNDGVRACAWDAADRLAARGGDRT